MGPDHQALPQLSLYPATAEDWLLLSQHLGCRLWLLSQHL